MIKRVGMFTRRSDLNRADFSKHWVATHRHIATSMPGMLRYIQNHPYYPLDQPFITAPAYQIDGIAEMWWESYAAMEETFASEAGRLRLQRDEPNFMEAITIFIVEEDGDPVQDGTAKIMLPMRSRSGRQDAAADWRADLRGSLSGLVRSIENRVLGTRSRLHLPADPAVPDCFLELRFRTIQDAETAMVSEKCQALMGVVGDNFEKFGVYFMAEHRVL